MTTERRGSTSNVDDKHLAQFIDVQDTTTYELWVLLERTVAAYPKSLAIISPRHGSAHLSDALQSQTKGECPMIFSWTYAQLQLASKSLAKRLCERGITQGSIIVAFLGTVQITSSYSGLQHVSKRRSWPSTLVFSKGPKEIRVYLQALGTIGMVIVNDSKDRRHSTILLKNSFPSQTHSKYGPTMVNRLVAGQVSALSFVPREAMESQ